jgi:hypothetical protein
MRVLIKGGLGNQLFQFCFLHSLSILAEKKVGIVKDASARIDRPFLLEKLFKSCVHIQVGGIKRSPIHHLKMRFAKFRFIRGVLYRYRNSQSVLEPEEYKFWSDFPRLKSSSVFIGYFQHWRYVESSWEVIGPEILSALSQQSTLKYAQHDYMVVHVRRGDYSLQREQLGVLKNRYYDEAIKLALTKLNLGSILIYVISDDSEEAKDLFAGNSDAKVIPPSELDEWGCLSLMSQAKAVVTANSTLSWWGGYLAYKNGGIMVIPEPWFDTWGERVGSAFALPGVLQVNSSFRQ